MRKSEALKKMGILVAAASIVAGCNDNHENNSTDVEDLHHTDEGGANITDRDREILDNRNDGSHIETDDGGTEANNDFWDGIGGEDKENENN